jgi:hypothetical protein
MTWTSKVASAIQRMIVKFLNHAPDCVNVLKMPGLTPV